VLNVNANEILLEIPKCGSRSLVCALRTKYNRRSFWYHGHHTLKELEGMSDRLHMYPHIVYAVIRNPIDRLLSGVNHYVNNKTGATLSDALEVCLEQSNIVFKPQYKFVEVPDRGTYDLRLWDMARIEEALRFIGAGDDPTLPHLNKAVYKYDMDALLNHTLFDDVNVEVLDQDFPLWIDATRTSKEGQLNVQKA